MRKNEAPKKDAVKDNTTKAIRRQQRSLSTALLLGVLAIVLLVNILANTLVDRFDISIDLSSEQIYRLTDDSIEIAKSIDKPVTIYCLDSKDKFLTRLREVITRYEKSSDQIRVEYVDLIKNRAFRKPMKGWDTLPPSAALLSSAAIRGRSSRCTISMRSTRPRGF